LGIRIIAYSNAGHRWHPVPNARKEMVSIRSGVGLEKFAEMDLPSPTAPLPMRYSWPTWPNAPLLWPEVPTRETKSVG
jgi:hypothetical protein